MKFGEAFEMMIHFVPLLDTICASSSVAAMEDDDEKKKEGISNGFQKTLPMVVYTPIHHPDIIYVHTKICAEQQQKNHPYLRLTLTLNQFQ
eukprot:8004075-Ditylum_brightwellii.AAC.1